MRFITLPLFFLLSACSSSNFYYDDSRQIAPADAENIEQTDEIKSNSELLQNYLSAELSYKREDFEKAIFYFSKVRHYHQQSEIITKRLAELGFLTSDIELALQALAQSSAENPTPAFEDLLSLAYLADGDPQMAVLTLLHKQSLFPDIADTRLQLAALYILQDDLVLAAEALPNPQSSEELNLHGYINELNENLSEAEKFYGLAFAKEETSDYLADLLRVLAKQGNPALADIIKKNTKLLADIPGLDPLISAAEIQNIIKENDTFRFSEPAQKFGDLQIKLATVESSRKEIDSAIMRILVLAEALPEYSSSNFIAFTAYRELRRIKSAVTVLNKIERQDPLRTRALLLIVLTLRAEKDYAAAQPYIEEALELNPEKDAVFNLYLQNLKGLKNIEMAEKAVADYLEEFPDNQYYLYEQATLLFELKRPEESHAVLAKLLKINPQHAGALNFVAYTYAESGTNLDLALDYVNRSLLLEPNNAYYLDTLAWIYYKQRNYIQARLVQEQALKLVSDDPVLMEHYADILAELGESVAAQDWYRQSLIVAKDSEPSVEIEKLMERLKTKVK